MVYMSDELFNESPEPPQSALMLPIVVICEKVLLVNSIPFWLCTIEIKKLPSNVMLSMMLSSIIGLLRSFSATIKQPLFDLT